MRLDSSNFGEKVIANHPANLTRHQPTAPPPQAPAASSSDVRDVERAGHSLQPILHLTSCPSSWDRIASAPALVELLLLPRGCCTGPRSQQGQQRLRAGTGLSPRPPAELRSRSPGQPPIVGTRSARDRLASAQSLCGRWPIASHRLTGSGRLQHQASKHSPTRAPKPDGDSTQPFPSACRLATV